MGGGSIKSHFDSKFHFLGKFCINLINFGEIFTALKGSIFLKNRHFIIQEIFYKLIYGINAIIKMWHLTVCTITVSLSFLK